MGRTEARPQRAGPVKEDSLGQRPRQGRAGQVPEPQSASQGSWGSERCPQAGVLHLPSEPPWGQGLCGPVSRESPQLGGISTRTRREQLGQVHLPVGSALEGTLISVCPAPGPHVGLPAPTRWTMDLWVDRDEEAQGCTSLAQPSGRARTPGPASKPPGTHSCPRALRPTQQGPGPLLALTLAATQVPSPWPVGCPHEGCRALHYLIGWGSQDGVPRYLTSQPPRFGQVAQVIPLRQY